MSSIVTPGRRVLGLPFLLPSFSDSTSLVFRRSQSTYQRTKRRLRMKPDASFGPTTTETTDHIIYNPPSSAPSTYHTPTKFLPQNDVRRALRRESPAETSNIGDRRLPVLFKNLNKPKKTLSKEEIEEMRRLRSSDPITWNRYSLAKKFDCNPLFAMMAFAAQPKETKANNLQKDVLLAVQSRWGAKKSDARKQRKLRQEQWQRDL